MSSRRRSVRVAAVAATLATLAASAAPARAQLPSHLAAQCVGGALGCGEVDFRLTVLAGAPASLDFFRLRLLGDSWAFADGQVGEAEDALGPTFFAPNVSSAGLGLEGAFAPGFEALANPALRVRATMDAPPVTDAASLRYLWLAGAAGRPTTAGMVAGFGASLAVACVGGALGCAEADFTFTLAGVAASVDYFRLWLPDGGAWRFAGLQSGEAEDALGINFFAPEVTDGGLTLGGAFDPAFEAVVDPTLRLRAQLDPGADGAAAPTVVYELGWFGRPRFAGLSGVGATTVPEPAPLALLAAGLLLLPVVRAARARTRRTRA